MRRSRPDSNPNRNNDPLLPTSHEIHFYQQKIALAVGLTHHHPVENIKGRIDLVPSGIVARLLLNKLHQALRLNKFLSHPLATTLAYALPDGHEHSKTFPLSSKADRDAYMQRKKITSDHPRNLTQAVSIAFRHLQETCELFISLFSIPGLEHLKKDASIDQRDYIRARVGGFFVEKSDSTLRTILDGRWCNALFDRAYSRFSMFAFSTLRQILDNLCANGRSWYAINLDLRHWFHQIPLADRYKLFMGIPLTDKNAGGKYVILPRAHAMGWLLSPIVAQCCTWGLVLHNATHPGSPFGNGIDYKDLATHDGPFSWLPFKDGGGIFVILDNILVVTPNQTHAENWFANIVKNCSDFEARLKVPNDPECKKAATVEDLRESCFKTMTKKGDASFNFHGVNWFYDHHVVETRATDDKHLPNVDPAKPNCNPSTHTWSGTRREMSKILGLLNWHRQVHGIRFSDNSLSSQAIRSIYQRLTPLEGETWESPFTINQREVYDGLVAAWTLRASQAPAKANPLRQTIADENIFIGAADAATNEATTGEPRVAAMLLRDDGSEIEVAERRFHDPSASIAYGELEGAELLIDMVFKHRPDLVDGLIILATDSMVAKHWLDSDDAKPSAALEVLGRIQEKLKTRRCRLYTAYINTDKNLSDIPSRDGVAKYKAEAHLYSERRQATIKLLHFARKEAKSLFLKSGGNTGGMSKGKEME